MTRSRRIVAVAFALMIPGVLVEGFVSSAGGYALVSPPRWYRIAVTVTGRRIASSTKHGVPIGSGELDSSWTGSSPRSVLVSRDGLHIYFETSLRGTLLSAMETSHDAGMS